MAQHRVLAVGDADEAHVRVRGDAARDGLGAPRGRDAVTHSVHDQHAASRHRHPVGRVDPRVEGHDRAHAVEPAGQQGGAPAERVPDEADRAVAVPLTHLLERPGDVVDRRVVGVPAAPGVEQAVHREPAATGAGDGLGDGDHPQHRELGGADARAVLAVGAAVQHEHDRARVGGGDGVDQTGGEVHASSVANASCPWGVTRRPRPGARGGVDYLGGIRMPPSTRMTSAFM